jgi:GT2 family glycosyltransferase
MVEIAQEIEEYNRKIGREARSSYPLIVTVILNTNRRDDTLSALASLAKNSYPNKQFIVLDNSSMDGSIDAIRQQFPFVQIIQLEENMGYAGNNNAGINAALDQGADWIFVLNEDTILAEDCLESLIDIGQSDPGIGILGPMIYHHDEPHIIQSAGGQLGPYWQSIHIGQDDLDQGQYTCPNTVDWISGCAILVRREVIKMIGSLDARFFYYWEETEWCMRARKAGWKIVNVPQAKLWHKGVQRNYEPGPNVTYYNTRNKLLMMATHHAPVNVWVVTWIQIVRTLLSWSTLPKWRSKREHRNAMWQGILDFFAHRWGMRTE